MAEFDVLSGLIKTIIRNSIVILQGSMHTNVTAIVNGTFEDTKVVIRGRSSKKDIQYSGRKKMIKSITMDDKML
jgi:hypothetical protein